MGVFMKRLIDPNAVNVPPGYIIEVVKTNLNVPITLEILENGEMYYGDSGINDGNGKLVKITETGFDVIAEGFEAPLTGITYHNGEFYVSHKGTVTKVTKTGEKVDLLVGLPSYGDHSNNRVTFGPDGKMYFGQGTATNSGVVGLDNGWVRDQPFFHDFAAKPISLTGQNFETQSFLETSKETVLTGAYSPFGTPSKFNELVRSILPGSGSVLRANADGSNLELVAWGLRNPFGIKFDQNNNLWVGNHGIDIRGSRPVKNCPDEFIKINEGNWYGWPDYAGGYPLTNPFFKPDNGKQPQFLIKDHPMKPEIPFVNFIPHTSIIGFAFNDDEDFGFYGDCFMSEFGPVDPITTGGVMLPNVGHRVTRIDMSSGQVFLFAQNKLIFTTSETQISGLERPVDIVFGNDHSLYILDFGILNVSGNKSKSQAYTGVIWKVSKV
ncbi:MAG: repeat containing protein [Haloplasmataceae bacterium]|jgi:glucose/arabinose dehydrogenase|nr:repeat containing protein [Haloplasmataceae bacterium]